MRQLKQRVTQTIDYGNRFVDRGMIVYVGDKIYHLVFLDKTLSILVSLINYCMTPYLKS